MVLFTAFQTTGLIAVGNIRKKEKKLSYSNCKFLF